MRLPSETGYIIIIIIIVSTEKKHGEEEKKIVCATHTRILSNKTSIHDSYTYHLYMYKYVYDDSYLLRCVLCDTMWWDVMWCVGLDGVHILYATVHWIANDASGARVYNNMDMDIEIKTHILHM